MFVLRVSSKEMNFLEEALDFYLSYKIDLDFLKLKEKLLYSEYYDDHVFCIKLKILLKRILNGSSFFYSAVFSGLSSGLIPPASRAIGSGSLINPMSVIQALVPTAAMNSSTELLYLFLISIGCIFQ